MNKINNPMKTQPIIPTTQPAIPSLIIRNISGDPITLVVVVGVQIVGIILASVLRVALMVVLSD